MPFGVLGFIMVNDWRRFDPMIGCTRLYKAVPAILMVSLFLYPTIFRAYNSIELFHLATVQENSYEFKLTSP